MSSKKSATSNVTVAVKRSLMHGLLLTFLFTGSQLLCPFAANGAPQTWNSEFQHGENALQQEQPLIAEQRFRSALNLVQQQSTNTADIEKCMLKLADVLTLRDKATEAQTIYEQLLSRLTNKYGAGSKQLLPVLMALGSIQESAGDHTTAISYYQRALKINQKSYGPYSPALVQNLHLLGNATFKAGDRQTAGKHYKEAFAILAKDPSLKASDELESMVKDYGALLQGNDNSNTELIKDFQADIGASNQAKLASSPFLPPPPPKTRPAQTATPSLSPLASSAVHSKWQQQAQVEVNETREAESNEAPNIVLRGMQPPSSDANLAPAYKVVTDTIFQQNRYGQGEPYYKRTIAADIKALGPHHPSVANDLSGLAQLYISEKRYADAEPLLSRALEIYRNAYGSSNALTLNATITLASVQFKLGEITSSAALYKAALSHGESVLGPNSSETADILNQLGYLHFHQGQLDEANTFYQWALASTEGAFGKNAPQVAACLKDYAQVLQSMGRSSEASAMETRAQSIMSVSEK